MKIGDFARLTGVTPRLLRYYEEQGLLTPTRLDNGYRAYDESLVDRVTQIRGLIDAGMPTRIVKQILPCLRDPRGIYDTDAPREVLDQLAEHRTHMQARIECLIRNRDAIDSYLAAVRTSAKAGH